MVKLIKHSDIDFQRWDRCIEESKCALVYGRSWYLDALTNKQWDALVWNGYAAVLPLCFKSKFGIRYLAQPLFAQQLGIFSAEPVTVDMLEMFVSNIPKHYWFIDMTFNKTNTEAMETNGLKVQRKINVELDLTHSYEDIYPTYSDNAKRNIKKIKKGQLRIEYSSSLTPIIDLFKVEKGHVYNISNASYERLCIMFEAGVNMGACFVAQVMDCKDGALLAGALFMISDNRLIFLFSGMSQEGKSQKAMFYLLNEVIKKYSGTSMILDFEGSMDENLARFYKGFGGEETVYTHLQLNRLPKLLRWIKA